MEDYHGYSIEFQWDRAYFLPFIQTFCFACGWIPIVLGIILLYFLFNHSPMYTKEFRNAIATYHFIQIFYDIHHSYLFTFYPLIPMPIFVCNGLLCRWKAPNVLLMTFTGMIAGCGSAALSVVVFMRLRNILSIESRYRISVRQSVALMGFTTVLFASNAIGFGLVAGDDPRKSSILNNGRMRLFGGELFDTPAFNIEVYYLAVTCIYGTALFPGTVAYSAWALRREKRRMLKLTSRKKSTDQGKRMLQIQLSGVFITFLIPLSVLISSVKLGFPTSNPHIHSIIRLIFTFFYDINSMVAITLHLVMNRVYQKRIMNGMRSLIGMVKPARDVEAKSSFTVAPVLHRLA